MAARLFSLALTIALALSQVAPASVCLAATTPDLLDPDGDGEGDRVSQEQFEQGQDQERQDQQFQQALFNALEFQQAQTRPSIDAAPSYTRIIEVGQPFSATWRMSNTAALPVPVTLLTVFTRAGTNRSIEIYRAVQVPPGGAEVTTEITAQQLQDRGIGAGQYVLAFIAFDANDARIGQFYDLLTIREAEDPPDADGGTPLSFLLGQQKTSGAGAGLLESWDAPADDPMVAWLADRAYSYDQAVGALGLLYAGRTDEARQVLEAVRRLEAGTGRLSFFYPAGPLGSEFPAVFTGTMAWVGMAALLYEQSTGDAQFRPMAGRLADTLLTFADPATGLIRGGLNAEGAPFPWISTEHNIDAYFLLQELGRVTGEAAYSAAAEALSDSILTHLWTGSRFLQGYQDDVIVLDAQALGGLFLLAIGERSMAETVRAFIEDLFTATVQVDGQPVTGYAPYHEDAFIWVEGSAMVALLDRRLGNSDSAEAIENALEQFQSASGGLGYASSRSRTAAPGSGTVYPELPQVASTAWFLLQSANPELFFSPRVPPVTIPAEGGSPPGPDPSGPAGGSGVPDPTPDDSPISPAASTAGPAATSVPGPATAAPSPAATSPGGTRFLFGFSGSDLGGLNIVPGMYLLRFLAYDGFGDLISDSFYSAFLRFLLG